MALRLLNRALDAYASLQVELHGQYSAQRLQQLVRHAETTSLIAVVATVALTPLPCIVLVVSTDMVPLSPPTQGQTLAYWTRVFFSLSIVTLASLNQINCAIAALRIAPIRLVVISVGVVLSVCAEAWVGALIVGFPVPFVVPASAPWWLGSLALCLWPIWKHELRANEDARCGLRRYAWHFAAVLTMAMVYPALRYLFTVASNPGKLVITMLLPLLKIAFRNWSSYGVYRIEDLAPVVVSFSIDVFHSLFLACVTQGPTSSANLAVTMGVDFVQGCASVFEVTRLLRSAASVASKLKTMETGSKETSPSTAVGPFNTIVQEATNTVAERPHLLEQFPLISLARHLRPLKTRSQRLSMYPIRVVGAPARVVLCGDHSNVALKDTAGPSQNECDRLRAEYVQHALKLLHMIEFYVLIEYTEVMVALIYSVYLAAMSRLPNRVYYEQLKTMTDDELSQTLSNVLTYTGLELLSFVLLSVVLTRLLRFPVLRILAFALHQQWLMVQSQLSIWVYITIQYTVEHFGNDYTFQFRWLRHT